MTQPTFTRASIAYKQDGTRVASGVPRFESTGLTIEEGTTNCMASADALSLGDARVVTVTNGQSYTVSTYGASGSITLSGAGTGTVTPGNPKTITAGSTSLTLTPTGTPTLNQVENKAYATSWIDGGTSRSPEALTIPTEGVLSASQGTIEFDLYINSALLTANNQYSITNVKDVNNFIYVRYTANTIYAYFSNTGWTGPSIATRVFTPTIGKHHIAIPYSALELSVWVDNVKGTPVSNPKLPGSLATKLYVGSSDAITLQIDTQISDLMISSVARPDSQLRVRT